MFFFKDQYNNVINVLQSDIYQKLQFIIKKIETRKFYTII